MVFSILERAARQLSETILSDDTPRVAAIPPGFNTQHFFEASQWVWRISRDLAYPRKRVGGNKYAHAYPHTHKYTKDLIHQTCALLVLLMLLLLLVSIMDARKLPVRSPVAARAALAQHALRAGRAPYASRRHPLVLVLPPPAAIAASVRPWPLARVRAACAREAGASGRRRNSACQSLSLLEPSLEPPVPFSVPFPLQCATRQKHT